jgi:hypothetical protein
LDLFCQEKYLLNYVNLKIKLRRSRDVFALMADADTYKIKIKDLALFVRNAHLIISLFGNWLKNMLSCM